MRRSQSPVSRRWRRLLASLRSAVLILILLMLFQTVLRFSRPVQKKAEIAVLLDASSSMKIPDDGLSRKKMLETLLDSKPLHDFEKRVTLRWYLFSDTLHPLHGKPDTIASNGTATNLSFALEKIDLVRPDAVLVASDGIFNTGKNPNRQAVIAGRPVFCLALGSGAEKADLMVSGLQTNELVYEGNWAPVRISLRGPGFGGRKIEVLLKSEERNLGRAEVVLPEDGMEASAVLNTRFDGPGFHRLTASVPGLRGETSAANNAREIMVRVLKNKTRVLLLADAPSPDLAFVKRALLSDTTLDVLARTFKGGSEFFEGRFLDARELDRIDVFWLLDVPGSSFPEFAWQITETAILKGTKPVLWMIGKELPPERAQRLGAFLPVQLGVPEPERTVVPSVTHEGRSHPFLETGRIFDLELPPVFSIWNRTRVHPDGKVLIEAFPEKPDAGNAAGRPLIVIRNAGGRKSAAILARGIFRWQLMLSARGSGSGAFVRWTGNAVRWLGVPEGSRAVRLRAERSTIRSGEEIVLSVQAYNESLEPVEEADVRVRFLEPEGQNALQAVEEENGLYRTVLRPIQPGRYRAEAEAVWRGRLLGKDTTEFAVSPFEPEFMDTRARPEALSALAGETGGRSGPPDSLETLLNSIRFAEKTITVKREWDFSFNPFVLVAILVLLCSEWFIRRRKGML